MAQTKTGYLRFRSPTGETVERPQEEVQSLRRAGFAPEPGQSLLLQTVEGGTRNVPVENLARIPATAPLALPAAGVAFRDVAQERYGGLAGVVPALAYGGVQGLTSGFGGAALAGTGAVGGETLRMISEAQPVAKFVGEAAGMVGQAALTGGLGMAARGAGAAATAAERVAPSLLQRVGREAASAGLYGAGSEVTEATLEGRKARPMEAAAVTGAAGGALAAAAGPVARMFGKARELVSGAKEAKLAEDAAARQGAIAKAEDRAAKAATQTERDAARSEVSRLREMEKAAAKAAAEKTETDVAAKVDEKIMAAGDEAKQALEQKKTLTRNEVSAKLTSLADAVENMNAVERSLAEKGLSPDATKAAAKLTGQVRKIQGTLDTLGAEIAENNGFLAKLGDLRKAKGDIIAFRELTEESLASRRSAIAKAESELTLAQRAARGQEEIARLQTKVTNAKEEMNLIEAIANAGYEHAEAALTLSEANKASNEMAKALGVAQKQGEQALARDAALDSQLTRIIPTEMRAPSESLAAAKVVEDVAKKMGMAPALEEIVPRTTKVVTEKGVPVIARESLEQVLQSASRMGAETFADIVSKMPAGVSIGGAQVAGKAADVFQWLAKNKSAILALEPAQREALAKVLGDVNYGASNSKYRQLVMQSLRSKAKATPLAVAETEVAQAVEAMTPEMAYSQKDVAKIESIQAERARQQRVLTNVDQVNVMLGEQLRNTQARAAELNEKLLEAQQKRDFVKSAADIARLDSEVQSLNQQIATAASTNETLRAAQQRIGQLRAGRPLGGDVAAMRAEVADTLATAQDALAQARIGQRIEKAKAKQGAASAEKAVLESQLKEVMGAGGLRDQQNAASEIMRSFRKEYGEFGKVERDTITNSFFAPGEDKVVGKMMDAYMKTPEGKALAEQISAAQKAATRTRERAMEAEAREEVLKQGGGPVAAPSATAQQAKAAMSDPAVLAATAVGGPMAGAAALMAMVASRSGKGGVRKVLTAISPMWTYTALEQAAKAGEAIALNPAGKAATVAAIARTDAVSRKDVDRARSEVDEILKNQEDAKNSFKLAAQSTTLSPEQFQQLEQQYAAVVSELEKLRPKGFGTGAPSAQEEAFTRAYRVLTDPTSLTRSMQVGSISKEQANVLNAMSPAAYSAFVNIVRNAYANAPKASRPRVMAAFNIVERSLSAKPEGLSVSQTQQTLANGTAQGEARGGESLGTRRPPSKSSVSGAAAFADQSED